MPTAITRRRASAVAAALLAVAAVAGCSSGSSSKASSTTRPPTTVATTTSRPAITASTSTTVPSTTPASAVPAPKACAAVTAADITAAGVKGTVSPGQDVSQNFQLTADPDSSACSYDLRQDTQTTNVVVLIEPHGSHHLFTDVVSGEFDSKEAKITGLGDEAAYVHGTTEGIAQSESFVLMRKGTVVVKVSISLSAFTGEAQLATIAHHVLGELR